MLRLGILIQILAGILIPTPAGATCPAGPPEWQRLLEPARAAEQAQDWPAAEALYRQILHLQTESQCFYASMRQFVWLQLGEVLSEQGQFEAAIAVYQTSLREGNDDGRTRHALAYTQERRDAADAAIAQGLATIAQDPDSPWGYRDLIDGLGARRQVERAWDLVDDRLGARASAARSLLLAQTAKDKGHLGAAREFYRQSLARYGQQASPTDLFALYDGWLQAIDPQTPLEDVVALYRAALEHHPNYFPWYRDLAQRLARGGQLQGAIAVYEDWIKAQPADVNAYLEWGRLLQAHGQPQAAIDRYWAAIRLAPRRGPSDRRCHVVRPSAYDLLVQLLQQEGRLDELLALVEGGQPVVAEIYGNLALALGYRGEAERAERLRDRLKALYPAAEGVESGGCGFNEF